MLWLGLFVTWTFVASLIRKVIQSYDLFQSGLNIFKFFMLMISWDVFSLFSLCMTQRTLRCITSASPRCPSSCTALWSSMYPLRLWRGSHHCTGKYQSKYFENDEASLLHLTELICISFRDIAKNSLLRWPVFLYWTCLGVFDAVIFFFGAYFLFDNTTFTSNGQVSHGFTICEYREIGFCVGPKQTQRMTKYWGEKPYPSPSVFKDAVDF